MGRVLDRVRDKVLYEFLGQSEWEKVLVLVVEVQEQEWVRFALEEKGEEQQHVSQVVQVVVGMAHEMKQLDMVVLDHPARRVVCEE